MHGDVTVIVGKWFQGDRLALFLLSCFLLRRSALLPRGGRARTDAAIHPGWRSSPLQLRFGDPGIHGKPQGFTLHRHPRQARPGFRHEVSCGLRRADAAQGTRRDRKPAHHGVSRHPGRPHAILQSTSSSTTPFRQSTITPAVRPTCKAASSWAKANIMSIG